MEFTFTDNFDKSLGFFDRMIAELQDPKPLTITNGTPYIKMLEYGGKRAYHRARKNRKIGVFAFRKGGQVTRTLMQTDVVQPPHFMARGAKLSLAGFSRMTAQRIMPRSKSALDDILNLIGKYGFEKVKQNTRVDDDIARQAWRLNL